MSLTDDKIFIQQQLDKTLLVNISFNVASKNNFCNIISQCVKF